MSDSTATLDVPAVPSDWTLTHEVYDAAARVKGVALDCAGVFRVTENDGKRPAVATCDACGFHIGVLQAVLRGERPSAQRSLEAEPF